MCFRVSDSPPKTQLLFSSRAFFILFKTYERVTLRVVRRVRRVRERAAGEREREKEREDGGGAAGAVAGREEALATTERLPE